MPYMDRPCDTQPGMKHRCTNAAMEYFRAEVMEMCHAAGLHQIDLLNGSKTRVTEHEYWAKKKGQIALDRENVALSEQGLPIKQTKFETDKDKLRKEIRRALADATSFEDFAEKLLRCGITVKESRGRLSYLTPDRTKPITARKLGDDFDKAAVFAVFNRNAKQPKLKAALTGEELLQQQNKLNRVVDIGAKIAEGKGQGYVNWAKKHNLKNMSKALLLLAEKGFTSLEELDAAYQAAYDRRSDILAQLRAVETAIDEKKELQRHVLNYVKSKPLRDGFNACKSDKAQRAYRQKHESEFLTLEAAKRFFDSKGLKKLPTPKTLQQEIEQLIKDKNRLYNEYQTIKKQTDELYTIRYNLDKALSENPQQKRHSQER